MKEKPSLYINTNAKYVHFVLDFFNYDHAKLKPVIKIYLS